MNKPALGVIDWLLLLGLLCGGGLIAAPFVSDAWVIHQNQALLTRYARRETTANQAALARDYADLRAKDRRLNAQGVQPGMQAASALASGKNGAARDAQKLEAATIAELSIPKLGLVVPVFDHTSDWLLQFGACRLDGTNYPVGVSGDRAVISAHRGIPDAALFTHLPALQNGARFYLTVGDRHFAYRVFQRQTITPDAPAALKPVAGQDLVTLMTCTPYMINSHRLLITGRRVPYTARDARRQRHLNRYEHARLWLWALAALGFAWLYSRVVRLLILARRRYRLCLKTTPHARGWAQAGRHRRRYPLRADAEGRIALELPGARYKAVVAGRRYRFVVRRLKDRQFTVK